ncbi:MAG: alpha/beta fold hydrolase [Pseudomonadota bacterium]
MNVFVGAAAGYAAVVGTLYVLQDRMIFPVGRASSPRRDLPAEAVRWQVDVADGLALRGMHLPARSASAGVAMVFGGNGGNAQDAALLIKDCLPDHDVVAFHYRGYRPSDGRPSEAALCADAEVVFDETVARLPGLPVVAVGLSLGTGVAAHLAATRPLSGAVLLTPFDSIVAIGQERYWWAPVDRLLRHRFESDRRLARSTVPIAVIAAEQDDVVPPERTRQLLTQIPRLVFEKWFADAGHRSFYGDPEFPDVLRDAVRAVQDAATAPEAAAAS